MKPWASKEIHFGLNYNQVIYSSCHDEFINWIRKVFKDKKKVVDLGGGNGRILHKLKPYISEYYSLDLNKDNIEVGRNFFKDENIHFQIFDIDEDEININTDIVLIDSVLTMINDPFGCLTKCLKVADYIFLNRTPLNNITESKKEFYDWGFMKEKSILWKFSFYEINDFCEKNNLNLDIINSSTFIIRK